ncbi:MAG: hypothetical protein ACFFDK_03055 [Promethearchaeota archaeon]
MKKIAFSLNVGLIGSNKYANVFGKKVFIESLKKITIKSKLPNDSKITKVGPELLIIFKEIPIKLRVFFAENFNDFIYDYEKIKNFDVIILLINMRDSSSLNSLDKDSFEEFKDYFSFKNGISILAGMNFTEDSNTEKIRINRDQLIEKAKELDVIYGYEITADKEENFKFFNRILSDFIFKFQYSSPELFDLAKLYGKELIEKSM